MVHTSVASDPVLASRDQIRETFSASATSDNQPLGVGDRRTSGRSSVERGSCQDEFWVTARDGVQLSVHDSGSRYPSHTVVFLHGLCLSRAAWTHQTDQLLERYGGAVRVISYDHRGHGRSGQAAMNSYRIEQLADDLAEVLTQRRVSGPLTLVGHSMGGMAALCYLARPVADRPIEPHGLVLVASAAGKLSERGLDRLLTNPDAAAALAGSSAPTAVGFLPTLRTYDQYRTLGSIRAKTVIVSGGEDPMTPPAHSRDLADGIPGAAYVHLPKAGHMLPQQVPHVINAAIRRAMKPHTRRGR